MRHLKQIREFSRRDGFFLFGCVRSTTSINSADIYRFSDSTMPRQSTITHMECWIDENFEIVG